ncbi:TerD family protein [Novosphingobium sp.]|uniref:TerD family protein n=1 Tax=Novosphingobium sp. TaxID=1874826 RepID=UPI0025DF21E9|nr:TerD family protein [Novosphingobium sp.]MCC6926715.1 TerD family protein [Novosphingobium sp.]
MQSLQTGGNTQIEASAINVAIDWPLAGAAGLDGSAYLLGASGKVRSDADMVFYNQPNGAGGAVKVTASSASGIKFDIDLAAIPADVEKVVFCVTVDSGAGGSTLARHDGLKLVIGSGGAALVDYAPALGSATEAALMVAELYRRNGWKLRAVGQGFNGGLGPLARSFGIDVADEPAPAPPPPPPPPPAAPPPPPAAPAAPVNLSKISLDKTRSSISLEKRGASFGEIKVNLNWNRGRKGFFGGGNAIDLDLGCLIEFSNGDMNVVQALGRRFGDFYDPPFIALSGDDRTGDISEGETMRINGANWAMFRRIAIFAYIYEGAPNWAATDGVVTITAPDQPPIEVRMTEGRNDRGFCGIAVLENEGGTLKITRLVEYFRDHSEYDRRLGFGLRWSAGRKD